MADYIVSRHAKIPIQSAYKHSRSKRKNVWQWTRYQDILVKRPFVECAVVIAYGDGDLWGMMKKPGACTCEAIQHNEHTRKFTCTPSCIGSSTTNAKALTC
ncbi:hypothetical protein BJV82DRAFT_583202 [Fennellomyces sp. T-0311]|nr:hypothetical protein BJV82DRAFT_583202 [Fennellomyces sp. T-0311]